MIAGTSNDNRFLICQIEDGVVMRGFYPYDAIDFNDYETVAGWQTDFIDLVTQV
jgi:hypothetical protein